MNRHERRAQAHSQAQQQLYILRYSVSDLVPEAQRPALDKLRRALGDIIHGQLAGVGILALEATLAETLAGTIWAGTSLDAELLRSHAFVETMAREIQRDAAGQA